MVEKPQGAVESLRGAFLLPVLMLPHVVLLTSIEMKGRFTLDYAPYPPAVVRLRALLCHATWSKRSLEMTGDDPFALLSAYTAIGPFNALHFWRICDFLLPRTVISWRGFGPSKFDSILGTACALLGGIDRHLVLFGDECRDESIALSLSRGDWHGMRNRFNFVA